ncbi:MAG: hypothetical protein WC197_07980 [Candidatus Gastranaerophilaceae bacterium]|jgi:hypothetical protein
MKKLFLSIVIFLFICSAAHAQPGFTPLTPQQQNQQRWQQERQRQNWDSMQRQNENREIQRRIDNQRLNDDFNRIDRDIKRIYREGGE